MKIYCEQPIVKQRIRIFTNFLTSHVFEVWVHWVAYLLFFLSQKHSDWLKTSYRIHTEFVNSNLLLDPVSKIKVSKSQKHSFLETSLPKKPNEILDKNLP